MRIGSRCLGDHPRPKSEMHRGSFGACIWIKATMTTLARCTKAQSDTAPKLLIRTPAMAIAGYSLRN
jgi:hypothetical protein